MIRLDIFVTFIVKLLQEVQDQRDDLERVNKQLRLEMEQLVNQQDDVGKNVGDSYLFIYLLSLF